MFQPIQAMQRYEVFFKESSFLLTDHKSPAKNGPDFFIYKDPEATRRYVFSLLEGTSVFNVTLYSPDAEELFGLFRSFFKVVRAAGGVVRDGKRILLIKRLGKYDLPKGHIEKGETTEACAIREVSEECGLRDLKIEMPLNDTWHIYFREGEWYLKHTCWYIMSCPAAQSLTPQTEEDIEEVFWLDTREISRILPLTYRNLHSTLLLNE